jgi:adenylate kinase
VPHIATGDLYRAERAADTELGREVGPLLDAGVLIPDEITIPLVRRVIEDSHGFILDGYPRNIAQAEALDDMLEQIERPIDVVLLLELDDDVARERLTRRADLEGRADDTPEAIERRLSTYHRDTEPLVDRYLPSGKVVKVHADREIDEVWNEIQDVIEQVQARA